MRPSALPAAAPIVTPATPPMSPVAVNQRGGLIAHEPSRNNFRSLIRPLFFLLSPTTSELYQFLMTVLGFSSHIFIASEGWEMKTACSRSREKGATMFFRNNAWLNHMTSRAIQAGIMIAALWLPGCATILNSDISFPAICKPLGLDSSEGISSASLV